MKPTVLIITGPTASGKSRIALAIARKLNGEIISADSMQVYRGMNIGTDKPSREDRAKVKHHLIDILRPDENFSVYDFQTRAIEKVRQITARKKIPIIVGGTGLYIRALIRGLDAPAGENLELRKKWENLAAAHGAEFAHRHLKNLDPEKASKVHPNNIRRVIRAIEILESGTVNILPAGRNLGLSDLGYPIVFIGISKKREALYAAINQRVEEMFSRGLVKEVKRLRRAGLSFTAKQALGYKEILKSLDENKNPDHAAEIIKKNTRHFAKRQLTWFKKEPDIQWIEWKKNMTLLDIVREISQALKNAKSRQ